MIGIVGSGLMGKSIAVEFAKNGIDILLYSAYRHADKKIIYDEIEAIIIKSKIENPSMIFKKINVVCNLQEFKNCELIIEALKENLELKRSVLKELQTILNCSSTIIASNTSSLNIKDIFINIFPLENVVGIHFFNPVNLMKLVEVSTIEETKPMIIEKVLNYINIIEKKPVIIKNSPGFIVNKLLIPFINNASFLVDSNVATIEDVDNAMIWGANHPIGPLKLADLIGLDIVYAILKRLQETEPSLRISSGLEKLVDNNYLGRKTKKGFYDYNK